MLAYYAAERQRWPMLEVAVGAEEAEAGIRRLARRFGLSLKHVAIGFTSGRRWSRAGSHQITLNLDWAGWRTIAHEFAHTYYRRKYSFVRRYGHNEHGRAHRRLVDRFCAWIIEQGWHQGTLAHEVAVAEMARAAQQKEREIAAACPPPIEARIAHRQDQVARLTRKIKALSTRRTNALRSLRGLERQLAKSQVHP